MPRLKSNDWQLERKKCRLLVFDDAKTLRVKSKFVVVTSEAMMNDEMAVANNRIRGASRLIEAEANRNARPFAGYADRSASPRRRRRRARKTRRATKRRRRASRRR